MLPHKSGFKIVIAFLFIFSITRCGDTEDKYLEPCAGRYGSENVIKNIKKRYDLKDLDVDFRETYVDRAPMPKNCDTIHLLIKGPNIPYISADTFVVSIGRIFFEDTSNKNINFFHIKITASWPKIGHLTINYLLNRYDFQNNDIYHPLLDAEQMDYTVTSEHFYHDNEGQGLYVIVNSQKDYRDFNKLASNIKGRYAKVIKDKSLSHLDVEIQIGSPACKLCLNKTYHFFYDKRNRNM